MDVYRVYYAVVEVVGQGDDTKMIRFIVFPDGTTFEFYGMRGSLRSMVCIDGPTDVKKLQLLQIHNCMCVRDRDHDRYNARSMDIHMDQDIDTIYSVFSKDGIGMLSRYAKRKEHVISCGQLSRVLCQSFAQCMKHATHPYASPEALAMFKTYMCDV